MQQTTVKLPDDLDARLRQEAQRMRIAELVGAYRDLPLGTVDASVVAAAERLDITVIATLDRRHVTVVRTHRGPFTPLP